MAKKKSKKTQIRETLVNEYGYSWEKVNGIKYVRELEELLNKEQKNADPVGLATQVDPLQLDAEEGAGVESTEDNEQKESNTQIPRMTDPEWHEYVMSLFTDNELQDGNPTVDGLRRVAEAELGEIIESRPKDIYPAPSDGNDIGRATVSWELVIAWKKDVEPWVDLQKYEYPPKTFGDVASVWSGNCDDEFAIYAEATAATRAEVRSLRKALKLKKPAAEELTTKDPRQVVKESDGGWDPTDPITDQQKSVIEVKCEQLGIDVTKFINKEYHLEEEKYPRYNNLSEVTRGQAAEMMKQLNRYQSDSEDSEEIPSKIIK